MTSQEMPELPRAKRAGIAAESIFIVWMAWTLLCLLPDLLASVPFLGLIEPIEFHAGPLEQATLPVPL